MSSMPALTSNFRIFPFQAGSMTRSAVYSTSPTPVHSSHGSISPEEGGNWMSPFTALRLQFANGTDSLPSASKR